MFKIKILTVGKIKEEWLEQALSEYEKRLFRSCKIEWVLTKDDQSLNLLCKKEPFFIALDSKGRSFTSETLSTKLSQALEKQGSSLTFVIGGAEGIEANVIKKASDIWSLSPLTFTHQMTRFILLEQIYRALEIQKGSKYHK